MEKPFSKIYPQKWAQISILIGFCLTGIVPIEELGDKESLYNFLRSSEWVFCLIEFRDFSQFQAWEGRPEFQMIARRKVGGDDIVLISNR